MPTQWAHEFYWNVSSTVVAPTGGPGQGGYPAWQASVIGSLGGGLQPWWERCRAWLAAWVRRCRVTRAELDALDRLRALEAERTRVLWRTVAALESPAYAAARAAVAETAHTLGFASREAWVPYARLLKASPGRAENVFRHVRACERTRETLGSTLTNPEVNLAVELAYCGYAAKGRYFEG